MLLERRKTLQATTARLQNAKTVDGLYGVAVTLDGYFFRTQNYGAYWEDTLWTGGGATSCNISCDEAGNVYEFMGYKYNGGLIYRRKIAGTGVLFESWVSPALGGYPESVCSSEDGRIIYTGINGDGYCKLFKLVANDSTKTLDIAKEATFTTYDNLREHSCCCSADGKYAVFCGQDFYSNGFQTRDYGVNWTECLSTSSHGQGFYHVACQPNGSEFCTMGWSGRSVSYNSLESWQYEEASWTHFWGIDYSGEEGAGVDGISYQARADGMYVYDNLNMPGGWPANTFTQVTSLNLWTVSCNHQANRLIARLQESPQTSYYSSDYGHTLTQCTTQDGRTLNDMHLCKCRANKRTYYVN